MAVLADVVERIAVLANSPRRDRGLTRAIYSYPAKFQAHLPAELIRLFTEAGELVVDPFSGGGTTGLEAFLSGRRFHGRDISPFACLLGRVKTTPVDAGESRVALEAILAAQGGRTVLDSDDRALVGDAIANEFEALAAGIDTLRGPAADLLRVAFIHTLKVAGRRDFQAPSVLPRFRLTARRIAAAASALPRGELRPVFELGTASDLAAVDTGAAGLVVTSPPYKDLDVEYGLLQIQRPAVNRSKRSRAIFAFLGVPVLPKSVLCGGHGRIYDERMRSVLAEIRRVLRPGAYAFFWIGFKTAEDRERLLASLEEAGLRPRHLVAVGLSRDRVASSRSTHHGRATGMLARDYLIACD